MEFTFQPAFCLQSLPRKAYEAGCSVGMGHSFPRGAPRKLHPRLQPQNGMQLPQRRPSGNCVPEFAFRVGCNFRLNLDWETVSHSHKNGRLGCWSEPPVWRVMSRPLACNVIPDYVVAVFENVVAAGGHGRCAVDGVHPAARAAVLLLGQAADSGDIGTIRRTARIHGKA